MENTRVLKNGTILNDKYRIEEVLGEGGFGITYRARDISINDIVAIKEYFPSTFGTRDTTSKDSTNEITVITGNLYENYLKGLEKFEAEAANLAKFNNEQGIVSVKNYFKENNTGYMVMEYISGCSLNEYLKKNGGSVSYQKAVEMIRPVMDSLAIVHKAGIIHRDISPDNIMVTEEGQLKLIDFGAARYVGNEDEKSLTVMLKAGYAPAEQYQKHGNQGTWTDVYALSATIYRMISGKIPLESPERLIGNKKLESLKTLCPNVPDNIAKVVEKGMSIDISKRYKTVDELAKALGGQRKTTILMLAGIAVAIVAIGIVIALVMPRVIGDNKAQNETSTVVEDASETQKELAEESVTKEENANEEVIEEGKVTEEVEEPIVEENKYEVRELVAVDTYHFYSKPYSIYEYECAYSEKNNKYTVVGETGGYYLVQNSFGQLKNSDDSIVEADDVIYIQKYALMEESEKETYDKCYKECTKYLDTGNELLWIKSIFDDFDGDGSKEMFLASTFMEWQCDVIFYFSDGNNCQEIGRFYGGNIANQYNFLEDWLSVRAGKIKIAHLTVSDNSGFDFMKNYTVNNGEVIELNDVSLSENDGQAVLSVAIGDDEYNSSVTFYGENGEVYIADVGENGNFPVFYIDGKLGECESCTISKNDFLSIDGAETCLGECEELLAEDSGDYALESFRGGLGGIAQNMKYKNAEIKNILYNESGYFDINYVVDVKFEDYDNVTGDTVLLYSEYMRTDGIENINPQSWCVIYDSAGNVVDCAYIDKISESVRVSYINGKLVPIARSFGEAVPKSGKVQVLYTSEFAK